MVLALCSAVLFIVSILCLAHHKLWPMEQLSPDRHLRRYYIGLFCSLPAFGLLFVIDWSQADQLVFAGSAAILGGFFLWRTKQQPQGKAYRKDWVLQHGLVTAIFYVVGIALFAIAVFTQPT